MRHWTQEERERQSALIRSWKPWEKATGPRTEAGKAKASTNATKHGMRSAAWTAERKMLNQVMRDFRVDLFCARHMAADLAYCRTGDRAHFYRTVTFHARHQY